MSPYDIIPLIIMVVSLAGIIFIIVRKFPVLAAIDVGSIKKEQEAEKKEKIIAARLERKIRGLGKILAALLLPIVLRLKGWFQKIYSKILEWEKYYAKKKTKAPVAVPEMEQKIKALSFAAEEDMKEGKIDEAEKKYIEIISLDHRNIEAYKKLGRLYLEQKNYDHAHETLEHILKLNPNDAETLIDLGLLQKQKGENEKALLTFERAVQLEPADPQNLDFLIEMSIIVGNKVLAEETFKKLREANPENQKLAEFEERIKTL